MHKGNFWYVSMKEKDLVKDLWRTGCLKFPICWIFQISWFSPLEFSNLLSIPILMIFSDSCLKCCSTAWLNKKLSISSWLTLKNFEFCHNWPVSMLTAQSINNRIGGKLSYTKFDSNDPQPGHFRASLHEGHAEREACIGEHHYH